MWCFVRGARTQNREVKHIPETTAGASVSVTHSQRRVIYSSSSLDVRPPRSVFQSRRRLTAWTVSALTGWSLFSQQQHPGSKRRQRPHRKQLPEPRNGRWEPQNQLHLQPLRWKPEPQTICCRIKSQNRGHFAEADLAVVSIGRSHASGPVDSEPADDRQSL